MAMTNKRKSRVGVIRTDNGKQVVRCPDCKKARPLSGWERRKRKTDFCSQCRHGELAKAIKVVIAQMKAQVAGMKKSTKADQLRAKDLERRNPFATFARLIVCIEESLFEDGFQPPRLSPSSLSRYYDSSDEPYCPVIRVSDHLLHPCSESSVLEVTILIDESTTEEDARKMAGSAVGDIWEAKQDDNLDDD